MLLVSLTADEEVYLMRELQFNVIHHRAMLDDPDARRLGVKVTRLRRTLKVEESILRKIGHPLPTEE